MGSHKIHASVQKGSGGWKSAPALLCGALLIAGGMSAPAFADVTAAAPMAAQIQNAVNTAIVRISGSVLKAVDSFNALEGRLTDVASKFYKNDDKLDDLERRLAALREKRETVASIPAPVLAPQKSVAPVLAPEAVNLPADAVVTDSDLPKIKSNDLPLQATKEKVVAGYVAVIGVARVMPKRMSEAGNQDDVVVSLNPNSDVNGYLITTAPVDSSQAAAELAAEKNLQGVGGLPKVMNVSDLSQLRVRLRAHTSIARGH